MNVRGVFELLVSVVLLVYAVWFWASALIGLKEPSHEMQLIAFGWACFMAATKGPWVKRAQEAAAPILTNDLLMFGACTLVVVTLLVLMFL